MSVVNKPVVSKTIALAYKVVAILIAALTVFFVYAAFFTPIGVFIGISASAVIAVVEIIILLVLASLHRTRYILTKDKLVIRTTKLIGGSKKIPLKNVKSVEKTMIPFGIRLFGASFHGGYYHIPGLGRAFLSITNFKDGLLIRTDRGSYVITPNNPLHFKEEIENRKNP